MSGDGGARARILARLGAVLERRERVEHPGAFRGGRPEPRGPALEGFEAMFTAAGGEVVRLRDERAAGEWLARLEGVASVTLGAAIPEALAPSLPTADAETADLGISRARAAIAETGTVILFADDGRRSQLLVPTHAVLVSASRVHATLADALAAVRDELPSAVGLHSGTSKSADIGQVMVEGVHGPGRVIALVHGQPGPAAASGRSTHPG